MKCGNQNCAQQEGHAGSCDDGLRSVKSTAPDNGYASAQALRVPAGTPEGTPDSNSLDAEAVDAARSLVNDEAMRRGESKEGKHWRDLSQRLGKHLAAVKELAEDHAYYKSRTDLADFTQRFTSMADPSGVKTAMRFQAQERELQSSRETVARLTERNQQIETALERAQATWSEIEKEIPACEDCHDSGWLRSNAACMRCTLEGRELRGRLRTSHLAAALAKQSMAALTERAEAAEKQADLEHRWGAKVSQALAASEETLAAWESHRAAVEALPRYRLVPENPTRISRMDHGPSGEWLWRDAVLSSMPPKETP